MEIVNVDTLMLRTKFCLIDKEIFERHKNDDGVLQARVCYECAKYLRKETSLGPQQYNIDWAIVWPAFMWQVLSSLSVKKKIGINIWCIVPKEWRVWWLPEFKELFFGFYRDATMNNPKQVIRDVTKRRAIADKVITELRLPEIEKYWDGKY
jgi:hypothetical protein